MHVPSLRSTNISTLLTKLSHLSLTVPSRIYAHTCEISIQKSWLNLHVAGAPVSTQGFEAHQQNTIQREENWRWCGHIYQFFLVKHVWTRLLIFIVRYWLPTHSVSSSASEHNCNEPVSGNLSHTKWYFVIFYSFLPFLIPSPNDRLNIIVGDVNHKSALPHTVFDLTGLSISPTRGNSTLGRIITNHPELICLKLRAPTSICDQCLFPMKPRIFCRTAYQSFKQPNQIKIRPGSFSRENILLLQKSFFRANSWFSFEWLNYVDHSVDILNLISNLCCPILVAALLQSQWSR